MSEPGNLILLNGASSAGKSTLARAIQTMADRPWLGFSLDVFFFGQGILPPFVKEGPRSWAAIRPQVLEGYARCLPALPSAGNSLVVDTIFETKEGFESFVRLLRPFDVFLVGVHCPLRELQRRESMRGDRPVGDAERDLAFVHSFTTYDSEVDSSEPPEENARRILAAWRERSQPSVLANLAERID